MSRVGVNLLWCLPGQVGGSEEYVTRAVAPVRDVAPDLDIMLFTLPGLPRAHPELAARYRIAVGPVSGKHRGLRVATERSWLAHQVQRRRLDLLHHAGGTAPGGAGAARIVLSIHDIQYVVFPQYFTALKRTWLQRVMPPSLRRATVITTPSEFVRSTLVQSYDVDPERIVVVPHGLPADFASAPFDEEALRSRYQVPGPFLLYPAATYPHKNHLLLLDALARMDDRPDLRLVFTGGAGLGEEALVRAIHQRGLRDRVIRTGRVPDADRDGLLRSADALVFPSRYEGFGAPVVEAMAVGTPVLAADATALPEVVGSAGVLLPVDDPGAWASAIVAVLDDEATRARLIAAGRARAHEHTAERSARALVVAYRDALAA